MKILLVGISTRALAQSATAAGVEVVSLDYFGDSDQPISAQVFALERDLQQPLDLLTLAGEAQKLAPTIDNIVIESGLENEPALQLVGRPDQRLFNTAETVSGSRDLHKLARALSGIGMQVPEVVMPGEPLPSKGRWLVKDGRHSGGLGVRDWDGFCPPAPGEILERYVDGKLASACFLANGRSAVLLGLTRQYAGTADLGADQFAWCGNVTLSVDHELKSLISVIIQRLVCAFGLVGLNGIDFIVGPAGPVLLEVNPRPPASFELFERLLGVNAFRLHIDGCRGHLPTQLPLPPSNLAWGKGILYTNHEIHVPDTSGWHSLGIADIPHQNEIIPAGALVCSILASDSTPSVCWQQIIEKAAWLRRLMV